MTDYKPKLIEVALPLMKINAESAREKSIRHGHPSTLHLWWARRPLAAARAVLWASLVDDPSAHPDRFPTEELQAKERDRLFRILEDLCEWEAIDNPDLLRSAFAEIEASCDGDLPLVLDPFTGGGTIPLEALRLGVPAAGGDLNPVAVTVQRSMMEVPQRFEGLGPVHPAAAEREYVWEGLRGLAADVTAYGRQISEVAAETSKHLYPMPQDHSGQSREPMAWFWVRTVRSPDPSFGGMVPLAGSWVLANKKANRPVVWVEPVLEGDHIRYEIREGGTPISGTISRGVGRCVVTGSTIPNDYIKAEGMAGRIGMDLIAVAVQGNRRREYLPVTSSDISASQVDDSACWRPPGAMSTHSQYMGTPRYGFDEWWKVFTPRQRFTTEAFVDALDQMRGQVLADALASGMDEGEPLRSGGTGAVAYSEAVALYLAFVLDRCISRWNSLSIWNPVRETLEHIFRMQTIQMTWVFAEGNPFSEATGGWSGQIDWVTKALLNLPLGATASLAQRDAASRVQEFDRYVLSTDPPYYDNVPYSDISDFFYVWMRRTMGNIWPDEFATILTPKMEELVADHHRFGGREAASDHFEDGMAKVLSEAAKRVDERFPSTIFYAFKATESSEEGRSSTGWETFLQAVLDAGLMVTATWPVRTEMPGGVRNAGRNSLATSVVLACRPRPSGAAMASRSEFIERLKGEMEPALRLLQAQNIAPVDLAQSAIGPGIGIFSRFARVVESDGSPMRVRTALALVNEVLSEVLSGEESELDADSRFALTWFEQFGHNPGPFGDANTLALAKDTAVNGVVEAGIAVSRDGRVRLLDRDEFPDDWSPLLDRRPTVWEATQHLIRRLAESESRAASLMRELGGVADRARQLAYLLYGVCEKNGWAEEAIAYNSLIVAWPELARLSMETEVPTGGSDQGVLL